jgi:hypothetical protein
MNATPTDLNQWLWAFLKGTPTPGTIPRGGVRGFKRETGWDIKKGKGTRGATLTLKDQPPCEGSITLQLLGPGGFYGFGGSLPSTDFAAWDSFVANVLSIPAAQQKAEGLAIYYPSLIAIQLTAVVVKHFTPLEHMGKGMYHTEIQLIEWSPPPPVSIVSTPASKSPDNPGPDGPPPVDPRIAALQAQIAAAEKAQQP